MRKTYNLFQTVCGGGNEGKENWSIKFCFILDDNLGGEGNGEESIGRMRSFTLCNKK